MRVSRDFLPHGNLGVSTPALRSTDATSAYGAREAGGSLPATTFLTTGPTAIGASMN